MQFIKSFLLSLFLTVSYLAAPVFVQQSANSNGTGNASISFDSTVTAGNSVIVLVSYAVTDSISSVSLDVSGAMTLGVHGVGTSRVADIYYLHNVGVGNTSVTAVTTLGSRDSINASEWSGLNNIAPGATNTNHADADVSPSTNSVTPITTNNLIIAIGGWTANNYSTGPTNSFIRMSPAGAGFGSTVWLEGAYIIQSSAAPQSTSWTLTAGLNWTAAIAVFGVPITGPTNAQRSAGFWS